MSARAKMPLEKLKRQVKKSEVEKLVKDLVRIPSHCDVPTQEKEVAEFLNEFLQDEGIDSKLRTVDRNRPNVIATIKGSGSGKRLLLSGHTDTVPAYEMDIEPFVPKVKGGRLYGRGSLDMKGGLGAMAMSLVAVRRARLKLDGDVIFAAVVGEERKSEGTEDLVLRGPKADMGIVGEPTDMEIQPSHRGLEWLDIHFYGKAAHGGQADRGVNAISMAAKFVNAVETDLVPRLRSRKARHTLPPTLNLGVITGGQQPSSVADHCVIKIDRRWVPEEKLQQIFTEIYDLFDKLKKEDASFKLVTQKPAKVTSFWGWTDAALLTHFAKTPTVVFGPGGSGAHGRSEYVLVDDLAKCMQVYSLVALDVCGQAL